MNKKANLSPCPTGVVARLSTHCTFSFGCPGFLCNFSADGTGRRWWVTMDGDSQASSTLGWTSKREKTRLERGMITAFGSFEESAIAGRS